MGYPSGNEPWTQRTLFLNSQNGLKGPFKHTKALVYDEQWRLLLNRPDNYELYDIHTDPSQQHDLASHLPGRVAEMLRLYEDFWGSLEHERPLSRPQLSSHATTILTSGWQRQIREGKGVSGQWALEVIEPGIYQFEVRRWPREAGPIGMCEGLAPAQDPDLEYVGKHSTDVPGEALPVQSVELKLSGLPWMRKNVPSRAQALNFDVNLEPGMIDLKAYMVFADGKKNGAYYVYVRKL